MRVCYCDSLTSLANNEAERNSLGRLLEINSARRISKHQNLTPGARGAGTSTARAEICLCGRSILADCTLFLI